MNSVNKCGYKLTQIEADGIANPTPQPIKALAAIITIGISWIFDVASIRKAMPKSKAESSMVFLRPTF